MIYVKILIRKILTTKLLYVKVNIVLSYEIDAIILLKTNDNIRNWLELVI